MIKYTPAQWLLINAATHHAGGDLKLDKQTYQPRLDWAREYLLPLIQEAKDLRELKFNTLALAATADVKEEFMAACLAIWDVTQGRETNYVVGLDACNSGAQVLSALTRCTTGMVHTGLIGTGERPDLYTEIYKAIKAIILDLDLTRKTVKEAVVPHLYGSKDAPETIFGENYEVFLQACRDTMPGLEWARHILIGAWNSNALFHEYILPNGSVAHMVSTKKIEFEGTYRNFNYTFRTEVQAPKMKGREKGTSSLAANVTHGFDGFVLSELDARCNYNKTEVLEAKKAIMAAMHGTEQKQADEHLLYLVSVAEACNLVSVATIPFIKAGKLGGISQEYLIKLYDLINSMLEHEPFETKDIHDEFGCHANHVNTMRQHYNVIMAQAYCSTWLYDVIQMLTGVSYHHLQQPIDDEVVQAILENDYSIC